MTGVTGENETSAQGISRRPLLKLAAGGAALTTVGVAARLTLHSDEGSSPLQNGVLALSTHPGTDVQSLHLKLDDEFLPQTGHKRWESGRLPTSTHSMVAFTWRDELQPPVAHVRVRRDGSWTPWTLVPPLLDLPDDEPDQGGVRGTDLLWVGRAEDVQIRLGGRRPAGLTLVLLYPEPKPADALVGKVGDGGTVQRSAETEARAPRPNLVTRKQWGSNESLRDGDPVYNRTIKQVHVHHTVSANNYARRDVPALIRGMYAYHTQTLGWSDIGYNFLVDRFGRAFVGRAGGPRRRVRGAHTLGFNASSTGISAIGNYDTAQPTDAMLDGIANVAAWKLGLVGRDPRGTVRVESEGSDRYPAGRKVRLSVIDGHRDTNHTVCPGRHLYDALPKIRRRAERVIADARIRSIG